MLISCSLRVFIPTYPCYWMKKEETWSTFSIIRSSSKIRGIIIISWWGYQSWIQRILDITCFYSVHLIIASANIKLVVSVFIVNMLSGTKVYTTGISRFPVSLKHIYGILKYDLIFEACTKIHGIFTPRLPLERRGNLRKLFTKEV